jgi:hypothetical protein
MKQKAAGEANSCSAAQYFLHFFETQMFITVLAIFLPLVPVPSYVCISCVFKKYFDVILLSTLRSAK